MYLVQQNEHPQELIPKQKQNAFTVQINELHWEKNILVQQRQDNHNRDTIVIPQDNKVQIHK